MKISVFASMITYVTGTVKTFMDGPGLQRESGVLRAESLEYPHFSGGGRQSSRQLDRQEEREGGNLRM